MWQLCIIWGITHIVSNVKNSPLLLPLDYKILGFLSASRPSSFSTYDCGSICEHFLIVQNNKEIRGFIDFFFFLEFENFTNIFGDKFFVILCIHEPFPRSHKKRILGRLSRFSVNWIQTNKQTNGQSIC